MAGQFQVLWSLVFGRLGEEHVFGSPDEKETCPCLPTWGCHRSQWDSAVPG